MCGQAAACDDLKGRRVLELGAGIGAAAIAAARCGASVLATDVAWRALALTVENAALSGVVVEARQYDWDDEAGAEDLRRTHGPFDLVIGAALQYETWEDRLWTTLSSLAGMRTPKRPATSPQGDRDPPALACSGYGLVTEIPRVGHSDEK